MFKHLDMLLMGIWVHPHTGLPVEVRGGFWDDFGVDLSLIDDAMPWLRLKHPVECNPHPYDMYTKCLSTLICYEWANGSTLTVYACAGSRGWIFPET